jgi:hypothetical protein
MEEVVYPFHPQNNTRIVYHTKSYIYFILTKFI